MEPGLQKVYNLHHVISVKLAKHCGISTSIDIFHIG